MDELEQLSIFDSSPDVVVMTPETEELSNKILKEEGNEEEIRHIPITEDTPYIEHEVMPYEVGDSVRVDPECLDENDVLNYNYLFDFLKKRGMVTKVIHKPTLQYEVAFGDTIAFMYHQDLTI